MKMRAVMKFLSTPVRQMTLIPSILREIRTSYKKARGNENSCGNENACGNAVLISLKIDWTSVTHPTGVDKNISLRH
jgi:hypothetical protein